MKKAIGGAALLGAWGAGFWMVIEALGTAAVRAAAAFVGISA